MERPRLLRLLLQCLLAPTVLALLGASAYERQLSSEAVREAYNLGLRRDQTTGLFLAHYIRTFSMPEKGPYIASVELLTPYALLVLAAKDDMLNKSVLDAEQGYGTRKIPLTLRVRAYSTATSVLPYRDDDIWKEFTIRASQGSSLEPVKKALEHLYPVGDSATLDYADMELQFDTKSVSSTLITIHVSSQDGQHIEAKFDLAKLK